MASSVACTVASKIGFIRSFGSMVKLAIPEGLAASGFAVENAMKISPEPLPAVLPMRANPMVALRANRFSWCARSGASVAITMMIEPSS